MSDRARSHNEDVNEVVNSVGVALATREPLLSFVSDMGDREFIRVCQNGKQVVLCCDGDITANECCCRVNCESLCCIRRASCRNPAPLLRLPKPTLPLAAAVIILEEKYLDIMVEVAVCVK